MPTVGEIVADPDFLKLEARDRVSALRTLKGDQVANEYADTVPPSELMGTVTGEFGEKITPEVATRNAQLGLAIPVVAAAAMNPIAAVKGVVGGALGSAVLAKAGRSLAPELGIDPETGATVGRVVGGVLGGVNPRTLLSLIRLGPHGLLRSFISSGMAPEMAQAEVGAAQRAASLGKLTPELTQNEMVQAVKTATGGVSTPIRAVAKAFSQTLPEQAIAGAKAAVPASGEVAAQGVSSALPQAVGRASQNELMSFAKTASAKNPKIGEKVWMELDPGGHPFRVLTPDQAGAAARAGRPTTWVKNLWGS
jgi:hypothetical protein